MHCLLRDLRRTLALFCVLGLLVLYCSYYYIVPLTDVLEVSHGLLYDEPPSSAPATGESASGRLEPQTLGNGGESLSKRPQPLESPAPAHSLAGGAASWAGTSPDPSTSSESANSPSDEQGDAEAGEDAVQAPLPQPSSSSSSSAPLRESDQARDEADTPIPAEQDNADNEPTDPRQAFQQKEDEVANAEATDDDWPSAPEDSGADGPTDNSGPAPGDEPDFGLPVTNPGIPSDAPSSEDAADGARDTPTRPLGDGSDEGDTTTHESAGSADGSNPPKVNATVGSSDEANGARKKTEDIDDTQFDEENGDVLSPDDGAGDPPAREQAPAPSSRPPPLPPPLPPRPRPPPSRPQPPPPVRHDSPVGGKNDVKEEPAKPQRPAVVIPIGAEQEAQDDTDDFDIHTAEKSKADLSGYRVNCEDPAIPRYATLPKSTHYFTVHSHVKLQDLSESEWQQSVKGLGVLCVRAIQPGKRGEKMPAPQSPVVSELENLRRSELFLRARPDLPGARTGLSSFVLSKRSWYWRRVLRHMAGGDPMMHTTDGAGPARWNSALRPEFRWRVVFQDVPTSLGTAAGFRPEAADELDAGCDAVFEATPNFIFDVDLLSIRLLPEEECGYTHSPSESEWRWRFVGRGPTGTQPQGRRGSGRGRDGNVGRRESEMARRDGRTDDATRANGTQPEGGGGGTGQRRRAAEDSCRILEQRMVCIYGHCGWRRPWIRDEREGRTGNVNTQLAAAMVASVRNNATVFLADGETGIRFLSAYLFPLLTRDRVQHGNFMGRILDGVGGHSSNCELFSDRVVSQKLAEARSKAAPDEVENLFVLKHAYCECFSAIWDWMYLVLPLSLPDAATVYLVGAASYLQALRAENPHSDIGIYHVRRGDKVTRKYRLADPEYTQVAVAHLARRVHNERKRTLVLVVISDEHEYAKRVVCQGREINPAAWSNVVQVHFHAGTVWEDAHVAFHADHVVTSQGTFSQFISYHVPGIRVALRQQGLLPSDPDMRGILHPLYDTLDYHPGT